MKVKIYVLHFNQELLCTTVREKLQNKNMYRIFNNRFEAENAIPFPWGLPVIQEKFKHIN